MNVIETRKLTKYYGKSRGIIDVDIEIGKGEFFGFIGPNGAGKSTTIRTLLGLISPTDGEAEVFGLNVNNNSQNILKRVGYLPSEVNYYRGMRAREIINLSAKLRGGCSESGLAKHGLFLPDAVGTDSLALRVGKQNKGQIVFFGELLMRRGAVLTDTDNNHVLLLKSRISTCKGACLTGTSGGVVLGVKIHHYSFAEKIGK